VTDFRDFPHCEICDSGGIAQSDCPNCRSKVQSWYDAQLAAAEARCTELSRVDWYWDDCHLECAIPVDEAGENNSTGDILELRPVHEMPKVWMLITDDGWKCFDTLEKAEREQEAME